MTYWLGREVRWIVPPKCASSSISKALQLQQVERYEFEASRGPIIGVARHPFDRLVSALYSYCYEGGRLSPMERYERFQDDPHIAPQAPYFEGVELDLFLPFERLRELPGLPHENRSRHRPADWRSVKLDWRALALRYRQDFDLWPLWKS